MNIKQKIFLLSFFLVILTEIIIGFSIILVSHHNNLSLYIENAKKEHNNIRSIIFTESVKLQSSRDSVINYDRSYIDGNKIMPQSIVDICNNISKNYKNGQLPTYMYLYVSDNLIYRNSSTLSSNILEMLQPYDDTFVTYISNIDEKKTLLLSSSFTIEDTTYTFITRNNINEVYQLTEQIICFYLIISLFFPFVVSFAIVHIVRMITKKINQLDTFAQNISKENYSSAPTFSGTDEVSKLSYTLKEAFNTIEEHIRNVEQVADTRKIFISELVHEINTPISSILLFSSLLNDKSQKLSQKKVDEYLEIINSRTAYVAGIKDTLMEIILNKGEQNNFTYCNISNVVKKTCYELNYYLKPQNITIETNIKKNVMLKTNTFLIQCLLENLIKNSVKSYHEGGKIMVFLTKTALKVVDFGCGIPENELSNIMKPYFSLSKDNHSQNLGIGLALCQEIAKLHNGKLEIKNNENKSGVTSIFYFDIKEDHDNE